MSTSADRLRELTLFDGRTWLDVVTESVATEGADLDHVLAGARHKSSARARHRAWAVIRSKTSASLHEIAKAFGVDHTTVLDGIRKHEQQPVYVETSFPPQSYNASVFRQPIAVRLKRRTVGVRPWLDILLWSARLEGADLSDVLEGRRTSAATRARHRTWYEIRRLANVSLPEIGAVFGVTHTSVLDGIRKHEKRAT